MFKYLIFIINRIARAIGVRNEDGLWMNRETTAFLIFNPAWPDPPRKWYPTLKTALDDANKLVRKQPQDTFYILKAVHVVETGPFVVKELPGNDK